MIYLDSNVPMYIIGGEHPNKLVCQQLLEDLIQRKVRLVTSVEVFQEIMHRYSAINRTAAIQSAFDLLHSVVDEIFPVDFSDVQTAQSVLLGYAKLSARDALHVALMRRHRIDTVFSFDRGFALIPKLQRLPQE